MIFTPYDLLHRGRGRDALTGRGPAWGTDQRPFFANIAEFSKIAKVGCMISD